MAEHLTNTVNRQDINMANLVSILGLVRKEFIGQPPDFESWISFIRCPHCVYSAFSHF